MKIVALHTDFRIYWVARLDALRTYFYDRDIELYVVEIAGEGSPYSFSKRSVSDLDFHWDILYPGEKIEDIDSSDIRSAVFRKLDSIQPEVVIAGAIAFPSGASATAWAKKNKKKVIIFDDAKIEDVQRNFIVNFVKQRIYNGVDAMLYPAEEWAATGAFWKFPKSRLFYGVDVVDNKFWQQNIVTNLELPEHYFLSVGRQIPKKNFMGILEAYDRYRTVRKDAYKLLLIGEGSERHAIEEYIEKKKLQDDIYLFPFLQQQELIPIYHNAEAFIIASKCDETWGLVINEAMASGLPVIASDRCGAARTLIRDGVNGYLFSPMDNSELTQKMSSFHDLSEQERFDMKKASLAIIDKWGLERFCIAAYDAVQYVLSSNNRKLTLLDKMFIKIWKGRYRPI